MTTTDSDIRWARRFSDSATRLRSPAVVLEEMAFALDLTPEQASERTRLVERLPEGQRGAIWRFMASRGIRIRGPGDGDMFLFMLADAVGDLLFSSEETAAMEAAADALTVEERVEVERTCAPLPRHSDDRGAYVEGFTQECERTIAGREAATERRRQNEVLAYQAEALTQWQRRQVVAERKAALRARLGRALGEHVLETDEDLLPCREALPAIASWGEQVSGFGDWLYIHGNTGTGKSRIAAIVVKRYGDSEAECWQCTQIHHEWQALSLREEGEEAASLRDLTERLRGDRMILVDDMWHTMTPKFAEFFRSILDGDGRFVFTSQYSLPEALNKWGKGDVRAVEAIIRRIEERATILDFATFANIVPFKAKQNKPNATKKERTNP